MLKKPWNVLHCLKKCKIMNKLLSLFTLLILFSCGERKEILLPKADVTVVKTVSDLSKIDFFFKKENNDTLADINKNAIITTTNWVFNIDKRLPLKTILPDIIKLQEKKIKKKSDEDLPKDNFYSYADSIGKNLAFLPFTNTTYKPEKPKQGIMVYFAKNNQVYVNNIPVKREDLEKYIIIINPNLNDVNYCFDKNMLFENYILNKLFLNTIEHKNIGFKEFVF